MIFIQNPLLDFVWNAFFLIVIGVYLRSVLDMKTMNYVMVAFVLAAIMTFLNRILYFVDYGASTNASGYFMCPICARAQARA
jgi:hypothetical protein